MDNNTLDMILTPALKYTQPSVPLNGISPDIATIKFFFIVFLVVIISIALVTLANHE